MVHKKIRHILETDADFKTRMTSQVQDKDALLELGIVDSFGLIQLIFRLEETFGIKVDPDDLKRENFESIHAMAVLVEGKLSGKRERG